MPRYYFKVTRNGVSNQAEALELVDLDAAWAEATVSAGELLKDMDGSLEVGTEWSVVIQDDAGNSLRSVTILAKAHR